MGEGGEGRDGLGENSGEIMIKERGKVIHFLVKWSHFDLRLDRLAKSSWLSASRFVIHRITQFRMVFVVSSLATLLFY